MNLNFLFKQNITYWGEMTNDGFGNMAFGNSYPVEIKGRWVDKQELVIDPYGKEQMSRAVVYLGQAVELGGYLKEGGLTDLESDTEPNKNAASRIIVVERTTTLKCVPVLWKVYVR